MSYIFRERAAERGNAVPLRVTMSLCTLKTGTPIEDGDTILKFGEVPVLRYNYMIRGYLWERFNVTY